MLLQINRRRQLKRYLERERPLQSNLLAHVVANYCVSEAVAGIRTRCAEIAPCCLTCVMASSEVTQSSLGQNHQESNVARIIRVIASTDLEAVPEKPSDEQR